MDIETLRQTVEQAGIAAAGIGFLTGVLFSINPVAVAAIPVALAYVTRAREKRTALLLGSMFIFGLLVTHVLMGMIAGFGGQWIQGLLGRFWGLILGPLLILLGLLWTGWIRLPFPAVSFRAKRVSGVLGAFALGVPFSVAVCPGCTPALIVLLGVVAGIGSPVFGGLILLAFAIGRSIPIALGAWAIGSLESWGSLGKYHHRFDIAGGLVLVLAGLYMLNAVYFFIPALAA